MAGTGPAVALSRASPQAAQNLAPGGFLWAQCRQSTASPVPQLVQNLDSASFTKAQAGHFMAAETLY
jgi:hypothetical protein